MLTFLGYETIKFVVFELTVFIFHAYRILNKLLEVKKSLNFFYIIANIKVTCDFSISFANYLRYHDSRS